MSTITAPARRWGSIRAAATEWDVHEDTVRRMIARGDLYAERIGPRLIRVDLDSLKSRPIGGGDA